MIEIGNKERIINILEKFESGLTYKNLLQRYKQEYGHELKECYVYLKRLKEKNIIESYKAQNTKGKSLTYKLTAKTLSQEPDDSKLKELQEEQSKTKKIVIRLLDGENISEEDYAYITRDN